jgi:hypothetical protein
LTIIVKHLPKDLNHLTLGKVCAHFNIGDNLLILTPSSQQAEAYVSKVGTSYIDSNLILSKAKTADQLG